MTKSGTREWAQSTVNLQTGCEYSCLYCFARYDAYRYKRIADPNAWERPVYHPERLDVTVGQRDGTLMFPSTHDITRNNWLPCVEFARRLLEAGNRLLLVSKPDLAVWRGVRASLEGHKAHVLLRFTITHLDPEIGRFWEPGAPPVSERLIALEEAHRAGWQTSVSIEPLLEPERVEALVKKVERFVSETIWIGAARLLGQRTAWCQGLEGLSQEIARIEAGQTVPAMMGIYEALKHNPLIRWKDSYHNALGLGGPEG